MRGWPATTHERRGIIMRHLLHFGIFVLALGAVTQADAQDRRRSVYDSRRTIHQPSKAAYDARPRYSDQRQDLEQIVRIADRWEQAAANRDRHAQWKVDRRLDAWLEREIRESIHEPHHHRYTQRVRLLRNELARLEQKQQHGHGYQSRGYHGRRYDSRGHEGRGHGGYYGKKSRILDELVTLSERQVQHARANVRDPFRLSFAHR